MTVRLHRRHIARGTRRRKGATGAVIDLSYAIDSVPARSKGTRHTMPVGSAAKDPRNNIGRYVNALTAAGILMEMKRRTSPTSPTSNGEKRWVLVRDLGRLPRVAREKGGVYDPNSKTTIGGPVVIEVEADHVE